MTAERLRELREALEAATPGPWTTEQLSAHEIGIRVRGPVVSGFVTVVRTGWYHAEQQVEQIANAHLIPLLRNAAPELLDLCETQARRIAELEAIGTRSMFTRADDRVRAAEAEKRALEGRVRHV